MPPTGRFAPSPSGPLHAGSLLAALGSYVDARQLGGRWLLRIDDIDAERSRDAARDEIIRCLARHGLQHDGAIGYPSANIPRYRAVLDALFDRDEVYACRCTRAELKAHARAVGHPRYAGTCRDSGLVRDGNAVRLRVSAGEVHWQTALDAWRSEDVSTSTGDFPLQRRDGVIAYQLAVVVDDHHDGVTSVVRGADLADNTSRQVYLQQRLGYQAPRYLHLPLLTGPDGRKLSKS
ncbi:MAG: tRNA glutamyl-Q(34) synthetase GluQRS, partial [Pseudomonadota bacterium]